MTAAGGGGGQLLGGGGGQLLEGGGVRSAAGGGGWSAAVGGGSAVAYYHSLKFKGFWPRYRLLTCILKTNNILFIYLFFPPFSLE